MLASALRLFGCALVAVMALSGCQPAEQGDASASPGWGVLTLPMPDAAAANPCQVHLWPVRLQVKHELPVLVCRWPQPVSVIPAQLAAEPLPQQVARLANISLNPALARAALAMHQLLDPLPSRSLAPDLLVVIGMEPAIGCQLVPVTAGEPRFADAPATARLYNPCHSQYWDGAGRLLTTDSPYPTGQLLLPPYRIAGGQLIVGELPEGVSAANHDFSPDLDDPALTPLARLSLACRWGDEQRVAALLAGPLPAAAINADPQGFQPLFAAVAAQRLAVVHQLLAAGVDPHRASPYGDTALTLARMIENAELIALLEAQQPSTTGDGG